MSKRSSSKAKDEAKDDGKVSPEEAVDTGSQTTAVEREGEGDAGETADSGVSETEELPELSKEDQQAAIAGAMGGPNNYPYQDRTAMPLHERNMPAMGNSPLTEASQAELNPAFYPKAEDGGPMNANGESIGTEPNAHEQALAAVENQGGDVEAAREQLDGTDQQMDAEAVTQRAQERAPEGIDASTGQPEGEAPAVPGEDIEGRPEPEGTAGASEENAEDEGKSQSDTPKAK